MSEYSLLDRRSLLERALYLLGAGAAASVSAPALAKALPKAQPYLAPRLYRLLSAVADTFVPRTDTPGALDALVPARFEALLVNWASGERRYELTHALSAIDAVAMEKQGKAFADLAPADRKALLVPYDAEALKVVPRKGKVKGNALIAGPAYANPGYGKLKELLVLLYYMSEPALTHELSYVHAPGEWKPSIPVTPETRPAAGGQF